MKHILLTFSLVIFGGAVAFGQSDVQNDPSYSVHNYKQPHKAEYARQYKHDQVTTIVVRSTKHNDNYKQSFRKPESSEKVVVKTNGSKDKKNRSYKHPYGL